MGFPDAVFLNEMMIQGMTMVYHMHYPAKQSRYVNVALNVKAEPAGSFHGTHMICGEI